MFCNAGHGLLHDRRFLPACLAVLAGLPAIVLHRAAFVPVRHQRGFTGMAGCVKKYNFTAADGGNSNKMRNFVS